LSHLRKTVSLGSARKVGRRGRFRIDSELAYGFIADGVSRPVFLGENKFRKSQRGKITRFI
jgi:hypothetical protein